MSNWLLLHYKIPTEPSALRVYIWRKLKRIGAFLLQDAVWVLPDNPRTLEQFQWLAAEIIEMGGEAMFWQGQPALSGQEDNLRYQFIEQVETVYEEILKQLQTPDPDLELLSRQYQQVKAKDYFQSTLGEQVRNALLDARGENA
jgi:uncharacterized protein Usg